MGLRLRQIRNAKQCSQAHFASILGVTTATYCKYERHTIPITAEHLAVLAQAIEVPIEEFFEREPVAPHANGQDHAPLPPPPTPRAAVHALPPRRRGSRAQH